MVFDHGAKARTSRSSLETKDPFPFDEDVRRRFVGGIAFDGGARSDCFSLSLCLIQFFLLLASKRRRDNRWDRARRLRLTARVSPSSFSSVPFSRRETIDEERRSMRNAPEEENARTHTHTRHNAKFSLLKTRISFLFFLFSHPFFLLLLLSFFLSLWILRGGGKEKGDKKNTRGKEKSKKISLFSKRHHHHRPQSHRGQCSSFRKGGCFFWRRFAR